MKHLFWLLILVPIISYSQQQLMYIDSATGKGVNINLEHPLPTLATATISTKISVSDSTLFATVDTTKEDTVNPGYTDTTWLKRATTWVQPTVSCDSGTIQFSFDFGATWRTLYTGESYTCPTKISGFGGKFYDLIKPKSGSLTAKYRNWIEGK